MHGSSPGSPLPTLHYRPDSLPPAEAFGLWRDLMAPMYKVERAGNNGLPHGRLSAVLVGDILVNRTQFGLQRVTRAKRLISRTPDHLVLQLWRSGGTRGEVNGSASAYRPGQVALADRRLEVDSLIAHSDTVGFVIPRSLLDGMKVDDLPRHLDARRNHLAAARIMALWHRLPSLQADEAPSMSEELVGFFRRLFDPSPAADVLEQPALEPSFRDLAERIIERNLSSRTLTPDAIAAALGISRAGLYRAFEPHGGIMRHVAERRLGAVRATLGDPLEARSLTMLAEDFGFGSLQVLSRAFRVRFGLSPSEWRAIARRRSREERQLTPEPIKRWFAGLGADRRRPRQGRP